MVRKTNITGFLAQFGGSAEALKIEQRRIEEATRRLKGKEAAYFEQNKEAVEAAEALAEARENLIRVEARVKALGYRRAAK